jgi:hypothetical protein
MQPKQMYLQVYRSWAWFSLVSRFQVSKVQVEETDRCSFAFEKTDCTKKQRGAFALKNLFIITSGI